MLTATLGLGLVTSLALYAPAGAPVPIEAAATAESPPSTEPAPAPAPAVLSAEEMAREEKELQERGLHATGLDARLRALCDLVALPLKRLPGDHREQRFAVLPFTTVGPEAEQRQLGVVVGDLVLTNLARDHRLPLVERAALGKILDEQALGQSGALADGQAAQVGKVSGARALIVGQVTDDGNSFRVAVRAVDAETAQVIEGSARTVLLPKEELIAFSANAVVLRSKSGAMFRSVVLPGWGQSYNDEPIKGLVFGATTGTLAAATVTVGAIGGYLRFSLYDQIGQREEDKARSPAELSALVTSTRENGEAALVAAAVLAGTTVAVWSVNVVDAYLSGTDVESLDAAMARN